jgi:hypothetical protein
LTHYASGLSLGLISRRLVGSSRGLQFAAFFRFNSGIVTPFADHSISLANRFSLVSSFFALTIHQPSVFRYHGDWARKKAHAILFRLNILA